VMTAHRAYDDLGERQWFGSHAVSLAGAG
jgi:hypothetical protein